MALADAWIGTGTIDVDALSVWSELFPGRESPGGAKEERARWIY